MLNNVWELVEKSAKLYRENLKLFIFYVILLYLPGIGIGIGTQVVILSLSQNRINNYAQFVLVGILTALIIIIGLILIMWFTIVFIRVIARRYDNKPVGKMRLEMKDARKYIWTAIAAGFISGFAITGGLLLVIIPGIIFAIWFSFVIHAVALDNKSGVASLSASKELVDGRWWKVLGYLLVPTVFALIVSFVFSFLLRISGQLLPDTKAGLLAVIVLAFISAIVEMLIVPFVMSAQTILYLELKRNPAKK